jgi:hypothetical protein
MGADRSIAIWDSGCAESINTGCLHVFTQNLLNLYTELTHIYMVWFYREN